MKQIFFTTALLLALSACSGEQYSDVKEFMRQTDERSNQIPVEEPPSFEAYEPFSYSGANRRSPFQKPDSIEDALRSLSSDNVAPDQERPKEFLEQFDINNLAYVGVLAQGSSVWALIRDPEGRVHRVRTGNYMGKDNGKIKTITEDQLIVLEIVPNGINSWIERPHNIDLQGL